MNDVSARYFHDIKNFELWPTGESEWNFRHRNILYFTKIKPVKAEQKTILNNQSFMTKKKQVNRN